MPRSSRAASAFRPCWCRSIPASTARSACCRPRCAIPICARRSACSSRFPGRAHERAVRARSSARRSPRRRRKASRATTVQLTRLLDLRYPHQGYHARASNARPFREDDKAALKRAFDALHPRSLWPVGAERRCRDRHLPPAGGDRGAAARIAARCRTATADVARAHSGERPLFDLDCRQVRRRPTIYDRAKLAPGDRLAGPAIIEQFDATTVVLAGQAVTRRPLRRSSSIESAA